MDFEKQAREIAAMLSNESEHGPSSVEMISEALRTAFLAGKEEMRDAIADDIDPKLPDERLTEYGRDQRRLANRIRSLPLEPQNSEER